MHDVIFMTKVVDGDASFLRRGWKKLTVIILSRVYKKDNLTAYWVASLFVILNIEYVGNILFLILHHISIFSFHKSLIVPHLEISPGFK